MTYHRVAPVSKHLASWRSAERCQNILIAWINRDNGCQVPEHGFVHRFGGETDSRSSGIGEDDRTHILREPSQLFLRLGDLLSNSPGWIWPGRTILV